MRHSHRPDSQDSHGHVHGNGTHRPRERRRLAASMILTGSMMAVEFIGGIFVNSLALVSDAGHMFTHFFALGLSLFAIVLASRPAPLERSFGLYRIEILAAFVNGLILIGVTVYIMYESVLRFLAPQPIADVQMLLIAVVGLVVNFVSAVLLAGVGKEDLNVRSAFLHMLGDTVSSVAVVAGAVVIHFTGWLRVDPALSGFIAVMIGIWSYRLLRDSASVLLESTPKGIRVAELDEALCREAPEIKGLHDIHVWEITSGMYAMTAHATVEPEITVERLEEIRAHMESVLREAFRIGHTAFQFESAGSCCGGRLAEACCRSESDDHR